MSPFIVWQSNISFRALPEAEAHIYLAKTQVDAAQFALLQSYLIPEEIERAQKIKNPAKRHAFIVVRGQLRLLLSEYVQQTPSWIRLKYGAWGKPHMMYFPDIQFNLSHSGEVAIFILARYQPVGIDVEHITETVNFHKIAQRWFSKTEQDEIFNLAEPLQLAKFYEIWTAKEALLKAQEVGVYQGIQQLQMQSWRLVPIPISQDYFAQAAVDKKIKSIKFFKL